MPLKATIKILFSLAILALLFHEVHLEKALPYFKQMNFSYLALTATVLLFGYLIAVFRWTLIMKSLKAPAAPLFYLKTYLKAIMFNQILPSNIGGDGYRMFEITKLGISKRLAITSVLADRAIGASGLVVIALFSLPISYHLLPHKLFLIVLSTVVVSLSGITFIIFLHRIRIRFLEKYFRWFYDLSNTLKDSYSSVTDLLFKLLLSVITNLCATVCFYLIACALHVPCRLSDFLVIIPLVTLISMIPISMAGWGVRESAMVLLGAAIGIHHPAALAISLIYGMTSIVTSLPGFYLYFIHKDPAIPSLST
ncbi:MAG: hypothetical protein COB66_04870 [Coxiella sp. (in: Bacteria)]|nr:MAG: hypothetical protein COB66_04870 [Coxiella sp. (in: g-proteobacteria)]